MNRVSIGLTMVSSHLPLASGLSVMLTRKSSTFEAKPCTHCIKPTLLPSVRYGIFIRAGSFRFGDPGLKIFEGLNLGGFFVGETDFVRQGGVIDETPGNGQFFIGGNRVVHAVDLRAGDDRPGSGS